MKRLAFSAAAALLAFSVTHEAKASMDLTYTVGGVPTTITNACPDNTFCPFTGTLGNFVITSGNIFDSAPGDPTIASTETGSIDIKNNGSTTQTIQLMFIAKGFTAPTTPPNLNLLGTISTTAPVGSNKGADTLSFQSCVNQANDDTSCMGVAGYSTAVGSPNITSLASSDNELVTITSLTAPYSIEQLITLTLGAGVHLQITANTQLTPVPEPMSIAMLGAAVLASMKLLRRKQNTTV